MGRFSTGNELQLATDQVIRHIRYTQHLAMVNDKFTPEPDNSYPNTDQRRKSSQYWYKSFWQLRFSDRDDTNGWVYNIFSDTPTDDPNNAQFDGNPNTTRNEFAVEPMQRKYMGGGFGTTLPLNDSNSTPEMALENHYGVNDISYQGCGSSPGRIFFDNLGRPYVGINATFADSHPYRGLLQQSCLIRMSHPNHDDACIQIEPITGYTHQVTCP